MDEFSTNAGIQLAFWEQLQIKIHVSKTNLGFDSIFPHPPRGATARRPSARLGYDSSRGT
jgi:hypothetical protein